MITLPTDEANVLLRLGDRRTRSAPLRSLDVEAVSRLVDKQLVLLFTWREQRYVVRTIAGALAVRGEALARQRAEAHEPVDIGACIRRVEVGIEHDDIEVASRVASLFGSRGDLH